MRLHSKSIIVLIVIFMMLLASAVGFYFLYVLKDVLTIEHQAALGDATRLREAFASEERQVRSVAIDWAGWDESYEAMQGMTPEFIESWMVFESYKATQLSEVLFFNDTTDATLHLHVDYDKQEVFKFPVNSPIVMQIAKMSQLFDFAGNLTGKAFFSQLGSQPVVIASSPMQDSKREKKARGILVIVKYLTPELIDRIRQQVRLDFDLRLLGKASVPDGQVRDQASVQFLDSERIAVTVPIVGVGEHTQFSLDFVNSRPIYRQAWSTLQLFVTFWIFASGAVLALAGFLINRFVITRLRLISQRLRDIQTSRRFDEPIECSGSDEIAQMTGEINTMLSALSERHYYEVLNARDKAQAASLAKTNFMAKVSHELRTPIHGILGIVGMMFRNTRNSETRMQLGMVRDSAVGLLGVVNDVLDFSKSEHSELSVTCTQTDIRDAIRKALRVIGPRLFERGENEPLECIAEVSPLVPQRLVTDGKRLTQILVNLLANAIKFTRSGSVRLTVSWRGQHEDCGHLECIVQDTGIGIPSDQLDNLFEPFRQVDDSVNRSYQGTGLGLAIVKQLVQALHGTVSVASEVGKGSSFRFMIPAEFDRESVRFPSVRLQGATVWMALDYPVEREKIGKALQSEGAIIGDFREWRPEADLSKSAEQYLVLSTATLTSEANWQLIEQFLASTGRDRLVALVSAHQLTFRERLRSLGVKQMVLSPAIAQDVVGALCGQYHEDFSELDDYSEIVPDTSNALNILVADDLLTNQIVLKSILQDMGHRVTVVSNGEELLASVRPMFEGGAIQSNEQTFDIVMTDLQMPVLDGVSALRRIREWEEQGNPDTRKLPVFLITAHAFEEEREKMLRAGATEVVTKPIDIKKLEQAIRQFSPTYETRRS